MNWRLALATLRRAAADPDHHVDFPRRVRDANRRIRTAIARINAFLQEHITGMTVVQTFQSRAKIAGAICQTESRPHGRLQGRDHGLRLFLPAVEFLSIAAIALVFWYGGVRSLAGAVDVGVLIAFMQWAQRFFRPIQDLSEKFNILQNSDGRVRANLQAAR